VGAGAGAGKSKQCAPLWRVVEGMERKKEEEGSSISHVVGRGLTRERIYLESWPNLYSLSCYSL
jgi:hypothetical protein